MRGDMYKKREFAGSAENEALKMIRLKTVI